MRAFLGNKDLRLFIGNKPLFRAFLCDKVVYSAEELIFQNGILADGITLQDISNKDGVLFADTGEQGEDDSTTIYAAICNVECTDYDRIDITLEAHTHADYGSARIKYGIGRLTEEEYTMLANNTYGTETYTVTIDISSYTGMQDIYFFIYAKNKSSEPTWSAQAWIKILEIKLYNGDVESGDDNEEVDLSSTDDGQGNVTVFALTGRVYATDDGEGNVTLFTSGQTDDTTIG